MSFEVQVNVEAEEDLIRIWDDIAEHNEKAADELLVNLGEKIDSLFEMPERGAPRDDLMTGVRMLVEAKYLVIYRVKNSRVEVLRVLHGSRDLTSIFK
jgi:toxin ParE1/3/4